MSDDPQPPDDILIPARWVSPSDRAWVERSNRILIEYGVVCGTETYKSYTRAKYQAVKLRRLMDVLAVHPAYQLITHTERHENGWRWQLEWRGDQNGRVEPRHPAASPTAAAAA